VTAADTSLVVAAFASWHERHEFARRALDGGVRLIEHCALETYSVLTRLPPPHRASGEVVREFLNVRFPEPYLRLSAAAYRDFLWSLPGRAVTGGAAYDALVAATAADHGAELISCDRRAALIYERYRVHARLL
jgi:predicted nucleic acid-binding protein